jgi:AcrR family transcriptional regulator
MQSVLDAVAERLMVMDESLIRVPKICEATGVNYGSVYHHFGSREGLIDAAYNMLFNKLVEDDLERAQRMLHDAKNFEEFVAASSPFVESVSTGDTRRARRAMRQRIVAAALMRPSLRALVGDSQKKLTAEFAAVIEYGQNKGWIRNDVPPHGVAVAMQSLLIGRTLDDISLDPISDEEWDRVYLAFTADLLIFPTENT